MSHPLDRPIWSALSTQQIAFSDGDDRARRFRYEIGPLAAAADASADSIAALASLIPPGDDVSLLEVAPPAPPRDIAETLRKTCLQMTASNLAAGGGRAVALEPLGDDDAEEMLALATLTRPGPFRIRTHTLGRFLGVRENGKLVAMAGERTRVEGFIEVSAVCTHPDFRGRGYGAALLRAVADLILSEGAIPYLHSYADNTAAVALYRQLGFTVRAEVLHAIWRKDGA